MELKTRSAGITTQVAEEHDHQDHEESPEQLMRWLEHFAEKYKAAFSRKSRCEDLMRRKKSKKWDPAKTAKMVRRLMAANKEVEQSENALDRVTNKLQALGVEVDVASRSSTSAA